MESEADPKRTFLDHLSSSSRRLLQGRTLFEAVGCHACGGTGYAGRVGIFEVLRMTPAIEELIISRGPASAIRAAARGAGMCTLRDAGLRQVAAGETTVAEVLEHTTADDEEVSRDMADTSIPA
jgi:type IV pilus assembly protein PilB